MHPVESVDKSRKVREMFAAIAGRYDFLNHFLSAGIDRRWRNICFREVAKRVTAEYPRILDVGCGTADLALVFSRLGPVIGCDFCRPMLGVGARKVAGYSRRATVSLLEADALALPFAPRTFDVVVSAFVLRNLSDMEKGLREMRQVLRGAGVIGILEFGMPALPVLSELYRIYFLKLLPKIGKLISGADVAYGYLPASVQSFPAPEELKKMIQRAGFVEVKYQKLTGGIVVLYTGIAGCISCFS